MAEAQSGRVLGFWACLALVMGNMIGSGVFLLPASLAPYGLNAVLGWIATIGGALCLAHVFARLAQHLPAAGGPYAYARAAFGRAGGFASAWSYWVMLWAGNGAIAIAVVSGVSVFAPGLATTPGLPAFLAVAVVWLLTGVNIWGVQAAARVQLVTTILKLLPLFGVIVLAAMLLGAQGIAAIPPGPGTPVTGGAIAATAALAFWGFLGLESATVPAGNVKDPRRIIPLATLVGTAATGLLYLLVTTAVSTLMPYALAAKSPAPIAAFIGLHWGAGAAQTIGIFAAISAFGALNGFILLQGEMPWAMARGGVFPAWFGKTSRRGTPARSHLVSSALLTAITLMNYTRSFTDLFQTIATVSIATGLVAYLMTALAALKLLHREPLVRVTGLLAAAFTVWALYGLGRNAVLCGLGLMTAGLPIYWWVRRSEGEAA